MMSAVKYRDGSDIRVGHRVIYNNQVGTVVVVIDDAEGSPGFPIENYASLHDAGILIRFDNGALLLLEDSDARLVREQERYRLSLGAALRCQCKTILQTIHVGFGCHKPDVDDGRLRVESTHSSRIGVRGNQHD